MLLYSNTLYSRYHKQEEEEKHIHNTLNSRRP